MATPICRCRVLYLGSAVPQITKDGLHGIQEPLRELYPEEGVLGAKGIDSWLSVWSNGLLLENVDEKHKRVTRFFPIDSLHYCAAVRHVTIPGPDGDRVERFLPLDSPFARIPTMHNPPLFACILRRTAGIKVLECHAFVCKKEMAANALVRCCFHSYADNTYARHLEAAGSIYGSVIGGGPVADASKSGPSTSGKASSTTTTNGTGNPPIIVNPIQKVEQWRAYVNNNNNSRDDSDNDVGELVSIYDGDENHKVWAGAASTDDQHSIYADYVSTIRSSKSANGIQRSNRPRQLSAPSSPPPPPPLPPGGGSEDVVVSKSKKEAAAKNKQAKTRSMLNGHAARHRYHASEFVPPSWPPPRGMLPPPPPPPPMAYCSPPPPPFRPHLLPPPPPHANGNWKAPKHLKKAAPHFPPPPPPHLVAVPMRGPMPRSSTEEPIYLPSARPISPVASYQPGAFPYEQYYLSQSGHRQHKAVVHHHQQQQPASATSPQPKPPSKYKKKPKSSASIAPAPPGAPTDDNNCKDGGGGGGGGDSGSKFNTGIYKKKGHLNERAFSYSIRQEHRSRSHGSLATLNFEGSTTTTTNGVTNGNGPSTATNGYSGLNGKASAAAHENGAAGSGGNVHKDKNGHGAAPSPGPSSSKGSSRIRPKKVSPNNNNNGLKNLVNDLSLSDMDEVISIKEGSTISRRRLVEAASANHR